jgi:hypothetical protein
MQVMGNLTPETDRSLDQEDEEEEKEEEKPEPEEIKPVKPFKKKMTKDDIPLHVANVARFWLNRMKLVKALKIQVLT